MPRVDSAVIQPKTGNVLHAPEGTALPDYATIGTFVADGTVPVDFTDLGHTSLGDNIELGFEGGDSEVKGTWQAPAFREIVENTVDRVSVNPLQIDDTVLNFYYGGGDTTVANEFGIPTDSPGNTATVVVVFRDGPRWAAVAYAKTSVRRDDSISTDAEEYMSFPLRFTVLDPPAGTKKGKWLGENLGSDATV